MIRPANLLLPLIASALLCAAGPDQPNASPTIGDVEVAAVQPAGKPLCTARIVGHQWPEEAADPQFAAALASYGYPKVCTSSGSTYVWRSVTLRVEQPRKSAKPLPTIGPALPAARKD